MFFILNDKKEINKKLFISIKNQIFKKSLINKEENERKIILKIIKNLRKIFVIYNYN